MDHGIGPEAGNRRNERLTLAEAIRAQTSGGAVQQDNADVGALAVGKYADLIVLEKSPFKVPADQIYKIAVKATVFGGKQMAGRIN